MESVPLLFIVVWMYCGALAVMQLNYHLDLFLREHIKEIKAGIHPPPTTKQKESFVTTVRRVRTAAFFQGCVGYFWSVPRAAARKFPHHPRGLLRLRISVPIINTYLALKESGS